MANEPARIGPTLQRQDSFRKRCPTLLAMAREISEEFEAHIAVVAISPAGEPHAFGAPSVDSVLHTYLPVDCPPAPQAPSPDAAAGVGSDSETVGEAEAHVAAMMREVEETKALVAEEWERQAAAWGKIRAVQKDTQKKNWWEVDVEALGEEELPVFIRALEKLRADIKERIDVKASSARISLPLKKMRQQ